MCVCVCVEADTYAVLAAALSHFFTSNKLIALPTYDHCLDTVTPVVTSAQIIYHYICIVFSLVCGGNGVRFTANDGRASRQLRDWPVSAALIDLCVCPVIIIIDFI